MRGVVLALWFLLVGIANADEPLACQPEGDCSDPCIYFDKEAVFISESEGARLSFRGKIHDLKLTSRIEKVKKQANAELVGDITVTSYSSPDFLVKLTQKITDTSCYYRSEQGEYLSTESCCGESIDVTLEIIYKNKVEKLKTEYSWGC